MRKCRCVRYDALPDSITLSPALGKIGETALKVLGLSINQIALLIEDVVLLVETFEAYSRLTACVVERLVEGIALTLESLKPPLLADDRLVSIRRKVGLLLLDFEQSSLSNRRVLGGLVLDASADSLKLADLELVVCLLRL